MQILCYFKGVCEKTSFLQANVYFVTQQMTKNYARDYMRDETAII
jgi:hypothetical protein